MRKFARIVAIFAVLLVLSVIPVLAAKTLEVEFTYSEPAASFNVYMDGGKICSAQAGAEQKLSCKELAINYGVHMFTMTAVAADGVESKHSPAYTWAYVHEPGDGPVMINLSVTLENGTVLPIGKIALQQ
ncbi:MAG: hypothetical protein ACOYB1_18650 [Limnohabitans sp.]